MNGQIAISSIQRVKKGINRLFDNLDNQKKLTIARLIIKKYERKDNPRMPIDTKNDSEQSCPLSLWALTESNRRPSACKADALNQLS